MGTVRFVNRNFGGMNMRIVCRSGRVGLAKAPPQKEYYGSRQKLDAASTAKMNSVC